MGVPSLIVLLPLLGSLFSAIVKKDRFSQLVTTVGIGISAMLSWYLFLTFSENYHLNILPIFSLEAIKANWAISIDMLSATMLIVVTTVSLVVHIYSIGYMKNAIPRFFSYLSLFTFCMIVLVVSDNFVQLFFGWEGVGLCSYLLIGFWFKKYSANNAALKAFIVNRIGDFFLLLGIFLVYYTFDSLEFTEIFSKITYYSKFNLICVLLFIGCIGKSAQLGLHIWLPDAMEGPTPASALIHAATMVTAGVFLIARCSPLFELSDIARALVVIIGTLTAFFAATVATTQNDIKKIIAYSTCSQLGYMFIACGISAYHAAIFHLMTHAFFKALLFLCAGNVIHAMDHEQNIHKMGNCWNKMPCTYTFMWIGCLALSGIFPFAGFYSKDLIIEHTYDVNKFAFIVSLIVALLTAFYSWRLILLAFHNKERTSYNVHDVPKIMLIPLIILALGSFLSGIWGIDILNITSDAFWKASLVMQEKHLQTSHFIAFLPTLMSVSGILCAYLVYHFKLINQKFPIKFLQNKWYFDEIYEFIIIVPVKFLSNLLLKYDIKVIDFLGPNGIAGLVNMCSKSSVKLQTGYIFDYVFVMLVMLIIASLYIVGIK
ncbi:NADH-quinone oxidoreductase subunit L [Wolbachia pipientis]|uniref:NADH-quinone oxidoreductase subunit L n=1 Tax=Wolbachia pipientis TaxID=955 RepID=A0A1E7QJI5_WOLPI|nr:NADH-quinone oxidoreductase subunit L [Wolbachia pipientis]OEY86625.1 NADH-quinone oxidoreductase subunit L [Wolbachia pipientis]